MNFKTFLFSFLIVGSCFADWQGRVIAKYYGKDANVQAISKKHNLKITNHLFVGQGFDSSGERCITRVIEATTNYIFEPSDFCESGVVETVVKKQFDFKMNGSSITGAINCFSSKDSETVCFVNIRTDEI